MVTYKIVLDERRKKSDGKYSLVFRITYNRSTINLLTGINIYSENWNSTGSTINNSCINYKELKKTLLTKYAALQKHILQLEDDGIFSFENLRELVNKGKAIKKHTTFLSFANKLITDMMDIRRTGNAIVYQTAVNRLLNYCNDKSITFERINYNLLEAFKQQLIKDGIKTNSISNYLRTIRAIYNKAIKEKIVDKSCYPFGEVQIKTERTAKRAIQLSDVQSIYAVEYKANTPKWHAKNYFLLSFYLRGISFTDLAYLKTDNQAKDRVLYSRRKTKAKLNIQITDTAMDILNLYQDENKKYFLPVLPSNIIEDGLAAKKIIYQWIKTTNKWLRKIAQDLSIEADITTYVTRHSWATIAKRLGYSNEIIAEALGHEHGNRVTNIYLDKFDINTIDEMNEVIIHSVTSQPVNNDIMTDALMQVTLV